ncbi:MAG: T9SS type A sorting domain-containing protein [bacterium]|nr:T9SS type A sorting domain-containing protein [bacterium]
MHKGTAPVKPLYRKSQALQLSKRFFGITFLIILLLYTGSARTQVQSTAWVVNSLAETMAKVNLNTGQVITNAITLGSAPNDIVIQDDKAIIVNSLSNNLQIIDLSTEQTTGTIELTLGLNPYNVALDGSNRVFVSNWLTGNVSVVDLQTNTETDTLTIGGVPQGVLVTSNRLYVTDVNLQYPTYGTGHLYSFSLPDLNFVGMIDVDVNPQIVKLGPDGNLHVVCTGNFDDIQGKIDIIDPLLFQLIDTIPIGGAPGSLAFNSAGVGYLGSAGWVGPGYVLSYHGVTHQIIHGEQNPIEVSSAALGVAISQANHVLVCCFNTDELVELDSAGGYLATFIVGDGPLALALCEPSSAVEPDIGVITTAELSYNFPNPFNAATIISFNLPSTGVAWLQVFDSMGRLITNMNLGTRSPGLNQIRYALLEPAHSGMYYYQIKSESRTATGSMLYLK